MKKNILKIIITSLTLWVMFFGLAPVLAGVNIQGQTGWRAGLSTQLDAVGTQANYGTPNDPRVVIGFVIQIFLSMLGVLFVGLLVYAGYMILTSQGEEEKRKKGLGIIRTSIIGLVILLGAYGISLLAQKILMGQGEFPDQTCTTERNFLGIFRQCGSVNIQQPTFDNKGDVLNEELYQRGSITPAEIMGGSNSWGN